MNRLLLLLMIFLGLLIQTNAQEKNLTGAVKGNDGAPLVGVTVTVKGTNLSV